MPLADIIQLVATVNQIQRAKEASALAQQQQNTSSYVQFANIAGGIKDPGQRAAFIQHYAEQTGADVAALTDIAQHVAPSVAQTNAQVYSDYVGGLQHPDQMAGQPQGYQDFAAQVGNIQGTGQGQGANTRDLTVRDIYNQYAKDQTPFGEIMRKQLAAHTLTGGSAGQAVLDNALSNLPNDVLGQGAQIGLGTQLSAGQVQSGQLERGAQQIQREGQQLTAANQAEQLNQQDRDLAQRWALGLASLDNKTAIAGMKHDSTEGAKKRLLSNMQFISQKATTPDAQRVLLQEIESDYDTVFGSGAFKKDHGTNPDLSTGLFSKITRKMGF